MKTYLLTAPDIEEIVLANKLDALDGSIRLYYATDEIILLSTVAAMRDMDATYVHANTPAEMVFDIGMFMGSMKTDNVYVEIFCSDRVSVPENLMKNMNIKKFVIPTKKTVRAKKTDEKTATSKEQKNIPIVPEPKKSSETKIDVEKPKRGRKSAAEKSVDTAKKTETNKPDATKTAAKKTETVKEGTGKKRTKKSETKKDSEKEVAIKEPASILEPKKTTASTDIGTAFLKQMSVRGRDLKDEKYSDDTLLQELVSIFKNDNSIVPAELSKMLNDAFSEKDAKIIYDWVKPNAKKLHELALQF